MRYLIFLFVAALIGGCSDSPRYLRDEYDWVPSSRIFGFVGRSDAHLIIVREDVGNGACQIRISIDGKPAAEMGAGEAARFKLTMGVHRLSAQPGGDCTEDSSQSVMITVKSGDELVMKIDSERVERLVI